MLSIEKIGSQYWLILYEDNGAARRLDGPFPTREQAESMSKIYDD